MLITHSQVGSLCLLIVGTRGFCFSIFFFCFSVFFLSNLWSKVNDYLRAKMCLNVFLKLPWKIHQHFAKHRVIEISRFWLNSSHFVLQNEERFWRIPVIERAKRIIPFFNRKVPLTTNSSFIVFSEQIAHLCRLHLFFLLSFN